MDKKKTQLNITIDPNLLIALKSEAIKSGKTLTAYVTERLVQSDGKLNAFKASAKSANCGTTSTTERTTLRTILFVTCRTHCKESM